MINAIINFDRDVLALMEQWRSPVINKIMILITHLGSPIGLGLMALVLSGWFIYKKKHYQAGLFLSAIILGFLSYEALKYLIARPRPLDGVIAVSGYSFPSGHATIAMIFFLMLTYFFRHESAKMLKSAIVVIGASLAIGLIGFSRVYLGAHWLSDMLAGYLLGVVVVLIVIILFKSGCDYLNKCNK